MAGRQWCGPHKGRSGSVSRRAWTLTWGLSCAWRVFACDTQRGSGLGQTLPLRARGSWRGRDPLPRLFLRSCVLGSLRCPPGPVWAADSHMPSAGHARLALPRPDRVEVSVWVCSSSFPALGKGLMPRGQSLHGRTGAAPSVGSGYHLSFIQRGSPVAPRFVLRLQGRCQETQKGPRERGEGPPATLTASSSSSLRPTLRGTRV